MKAPKATKPLTYLSLFAGIGGFDLGFDRAGLRCVGQVEKNPFCQKVLQKHWPDVPKFKDVKDVGKHNLPSADVIVGGWPCQDLSPASSTRSGLSGERSGLWEEYYRIICEVKPGWIVAENHPNLLASKKGMGFGKILRQLAEIGYDAEWQVLPAAAFGAPHIRDRLFMVAYSNKINGKKRMGDTEGGKSSIFKREKPKRSGFWIQTPDGINRMDDGISSRTYRDRVEAGGNAVVPQIAEFIGRCLVAANGGHE